MYRLFGLVALHIIHNLIITFIFFFQKKKRIGAIQIKSNQIALYYAITTVV